MSTIKYFAMPSHGWKDADEYNDFRDSWRAANPSGFYVNFGFRTVDDLVSSIERLIQSAGDYPCLEYLEICAHGNNGKVDGLTIHNVNQWGQRLKTLNSWCDEAVIYLAGCNTGLKRGKEPGIAELLANAMQFDPNNFSHRIRVYGSKGYLYGTHAMGSECTECTIITASTKLKKFFGFVWGFIYSGGSTLQAVMEAGTVVVQDRPFRGCEDANGNSAWNEYRNWS